MTLARPMFPPRAEPTDAFPAALLKQQLARERALQRAARLRQKARDEIDRLIAFLDSSDPYAATELEDQIDDGPIDESELEASLCGVTVAAPNMRQDAFDGEQEEGNDEPSLGWTDEESARGRYAGTGRRADLEEACEDEGCTV